MTIVRGFKFKDGFYKLRNENSSYETKRQWVIEVKTECKYEQTYQVLMMHKNDKWVWYTDEENENDKEDSKPIPIHRLRETITVDCKLSEKQFNQIKKEVTVNKL